MTKFEAFLNLYVTYLASKHEGNEYWQTDAQIIENCGGKDEIKNIYYLWDWVSPEKQKEVCGFTSADLLQYLSTHDIWRKAQEFFGDSECGYVGFDHVIRETEMKHNISLTLQNMSNYKWTILDEAMKARPNCTDLFLMADVISEITGVKYVRDELERYQILWESQM